MGKVLIFLLSFINVAFFQLEISFLHFWTEISQQGNDFPTFFDSQKFKLGSVPPP